MHLNSRYSLYLRSGVSAMTGVLHDLLRNFDHNNQHVYICLPGSHMTCHNFPDMQRWLIVIIIRSEDILALIGSWCSK